MLDINKLKFKEGGNDVWFLVYDDSRGKYSYHIACIEENDELKSAVRHLVKFAITEGAFSSHLDSEHDTLPKFRQYAKKYWPDDYVVVFVKKQDEMLAYIGKPNDDILQRFSLEECLGVAISTNSDILSM